VSENANIVLPEESSRVAPASPQRIPVRAGGLDVMVERSCDLETLWESMGQDEFGEDERVPYWAELWPAAVGLARWLADNPDEVRGRRVLEAGCGLGLSATVAALLSASVAAFDYEPEAARHARRNMEINGADAVALAMDWRAPAVAPGTFDLVLAADVLYEKRFVQPLAGLFAHALAPGGRVWMAEPDREVSQPAMYRFLELGFSHRRLHFEKVSIQEKTMGIHIIELRRKGTRSESMGRG
jgi:predicted nicotinamide N-methyase